MSSQIALQFIKRMDWDATASDLIVGQKVIIKGVEDKANNSITASKVHIVTNNPARNIR